MYPSKQNAEDEKKLLIRRGSMKFSIGVHQSVDTPVLQSQTSQKRAVRILRFDDILSSLTKVRKCRVFFIIKGKVVGRGQFIRCHSVFARDCRLYFKRDECVTCLVT